ncbi:hypothetical protein D3C87_842830 [compost metagenome]
MGKSFVGFIVDIEPAAISTNVNIAGPVFVKSFYIIIAQTVFIVFLAYQFKLVCLRTIQVHTSAVGTNPQIFLPIDKEGRNCTLR